MCKAGKGFKLSFKSITSCEMLRLLRDIQINKPELWSKITSPQCAAANATDNIEELPDYISGEDEIEDEIEVLVDVVMEYMSLGGIIVVEGFAVGTDGALQVKNDSEEYEREPEDISEQPEEIEYG
jgi:hypothetical protein